MARDNLSSSHGSRLSTGTSGTVYRQEGRSGAVPNRFPGQEAIEEDEDGHDVDPQAGRSVCPVDPGACAPRPPTEPYEMISLIPFLGTAR